MALTDVLADLAPESKRKKSENPRKYVQFDHEEWKGLEKAAGHTLETSYVKALIQGIFNGKYNVSIKKP